MGHDPTSRTILTLLAAAGLLGFLYLVRDLLPPFLIAFGIALLMDPVVHRFQQRGVRRGIAVALTFTSFLAVFLGAIIVLLPLAVAQSAQLAASIQDYYNQGMTSLKALAAHHNALL